MNIFPYSNFHELNLDWIIDELKKTNENLVDFIKLNTIKYADPLQWDITDSYEANTVVIDEKTGYAYLSSQPVPPGVDIERAEYWVPVFNVYTIYEQIKDGVAYNNRSSDTSLFDIPNGGLVWVDQKLYKATKDIGKGDRFTSSNTTPTTVNDELLNLLNGLNSNTSEIGSVKDNIRALTNNLTDVNSKTDKNTVDIAKNTTEIAKNTTEIAKNTGDIETLKADIKTPIKGWKSVLDFGAKGDGVTDDTAAFRAAIEYCITNNVGLYIPAVGLWDNDGGYILSKTLNIDYPMVVFAEPNTVLNWKNAHLNTDNTTKKGRNNSTLYNSGFGINIDYGTYSGHKGWYRFGVIQGDKSYTIKGGSQPSGHYWTGLRIANSDLVDWKNVYFSYWSKAIELTSTNSWTDNNRIEFQVCDDCETGISINPATNYPVENTEIYFNTIGISKNSIEFVGKGKFMNSKIVGMQLFVEYDDGLCLGQWNGCEVSNCTIDINNASNHNTEVTRLKTGSSTTFYKDIIGGENGVFNANNTVFAVGVDKSQNASFNCVHVEGAGNTVLNPSVGVEGSVASPVALVTSGDIGEFNGGKRLLANKSIVSFSRDSVIPAGEDITVYAHSYLVGGETPVSIVPCGNNGGVYAWSVADTAYKQRIAVHLHAITELPANWVMKFILTV